MLISRLSFKDAEFLLMESQLDEHIPFCKPHICGDEIDLIRAAISNSLIHSNNTYTRSCEQKIQQVTRAGHVHLTNSCTSALETVAFVLGLGPGDEVIMPSFTFSSTANAFAARGVKPVFVDIRPDTLNIDENKIESAISDRTVAIITVHYAGVPCEMDRIMEIAEAHSLVVVEDAAQTYLSEYKGKSLGAIGHFGCISFHSTKNIIAGEAGALLVKSPQHSFKAEVVIEKGTDRSQFIRGEVDKYTWRELGSSYLPSEIVSAFLLSQLENAEKLTKLRSAVWETYFQETKILEDQGMLVRPTIPKGCKHNAHIFFVILNPNLDREKLIAFMMDNGVQPTSHYTPLHNSPAGQKYTRFVGDLINTEYVSKQILRLPIWPGMTESQISKVVKILSLGVKKFS